MARHMSRHSGVSCDACGKGGFSGKRFKCLLCYDFDLCSDCHEAGETGSGRHSTSHPMQCILTRVDADLYYGGESHSVETPLSFTCPLCAQPGFSEAQLRDHVTKQHGDSASSQEVICPVCASHPNGDPNHLTDDFFNHLTMDHRPPVDYELVEQSTVQSRVRRLIGRRRGGGGLDRYVGMFQREAAPLPDSVDPITELLSQLSGGGHASGAGGGSSGNGGSGVGGGGVSVPAVSVGGGGGAGGRRFFPDMPVHVQHLLEERQHFDRVSPSRRTVYRKIVSGMQGSGNMSMGYHLPGQHPVLPPRPLIDMGVGLDLSRGGPTTSSATRDSRKEKTPSSTSREGHLLASYSLPPLSETEKATLEQTRADKSLFVQELLLSMLAASSDSSSDSSGSEEGT